MRIRTRPTSRSRRITSPFSFSRCFRCRRLGLAGQLFFPVCAPTIPLRLCPFLCLYGYGPASVLHGTKAIHLHGGFDERSSLDEAWFKKKKGLGGGSVLLKIPGLGGSGASMARRSWRQIRDG